MLDKAKLRLLEKLDGWKQLKFLNQSEVANQKKQQLFEMASNGETKPHGKSQLGQALYCYTNKKRNIYDAVFDKQIRKLRPDWFASVVNQKKQQLFEMASNGETKPHGKSQLGQALRNYTTATTNGYDSEFDNKIRKLRPDWFVQRKFLSFKKARQFVVSLNLHGKIAWQLYCASGEKPSNIPSNPNSTYKQDWLGYGDWLGTGRAKNSDLKFLSFKSARKFAISLGLKNKEQWDSYCKNNPMQNIPKSPSSAYGVKGWISWGDWLGTGRIQNGNRKFRSFKTARKFVRSLNFKRVREWKEYAKSDDRPKDIPSSPHVLYKQDWVDYGDWLGTGRVKNGSREYLPFKVARKFVRSLNLKSFKEWQAYCTSGKKPDNIPSAAYRIYKRSWAGMRDWLAS